MFSALFSGITQGCLERLPYLGYSLLLGLLFIGFGLAIGASIGIAEHVVGGDLQQARGRLREWLTLPFLIVMPVVLALFVFAATNIMAKRIRDTGLPGWWSVLAIVLLTGGVSWAVSQQAGSGLHTLIWLALLLIPGDAFSGGTRETGRT